MSPERQATDPGNFLERRVLVALSSHVFGKEHVWLQRIADVPDPYVG